MEEKLNEEINLEFDDNFVINDTYTILLNRKIGSGSFGQIYQCLNTKTKEIFACKMESINELNPQLYHESKIMNIMKNCTGFPTCYSFCYIEQDKIIIMDYLGPNLDNIMNKLPNKKYSIKTSLMIMIQCLERLKNLHDKGIIHRDMKPENFVIGRKNKERLIYLIDFGLSRKYINDNNIHISMKKDRNIIGTVRYISMNTHQGFEQSRRDDLESLIYIIIYFIKGELPWQGVKYKNKSEKYSKIYEMKKKSTVKGGELCESIPAEFQTIIDYIIGLEFTEKPNYSMIKNIIDIILAKLNYNNDLQFDWYNLEFLKNLYKSPFIDNNNQKKSSNNNNKDNENKEIMTAKIKENNKLENIEISNKNDKKNELFKSFNNIQTDANKDKKNLNHNNHFKKNKSISKAKHNSINFENKNKYKSPDNNKFNFDRNINKGNDEIKKVKTFLEGKNYKNNNHVNENTNNKENLKIKFMKSNNVIPHLLKKKDL